MRRPHSELPDVAFFPAKMLNFWLLLRQFTNVWAIFCLFATYKIRLFCQNSVFIGHFWPLSEMKSCSSGPILQRGNGALHINDISYCDQQSRLPRKKNEMGQDKP